MDHMDYHVHGKPEIDHDWPWSTMFKRGQASLTMVKYGHQF